MRAGEGGTGGESIERVSTEVRNYGCFLSPNIKTRDPTGGDQKPNTKQNLALNCSLVVKI